MYHSILRIDEGFNQKFESVENVPKHYKKRCQELLRGIHDSDVSVNNLRCLFSKGVNVLVNSCSHHTTDPNLAGLKLLHLADLFYNSFKEIIVEVKDLVK